MKLIHLLVFVSILSSCATQRPTSWSNYETDLDYPMEVFPYLFQEKSVYDNPLAGVLLRYVDQNNPSDFLSIYVYPIAAISWEDRNAILEKEMDNVLKEVDYMIEMGRYKSRGTEDRTPIHFSDSKNTFEGLESKFDLVFSSGKTYNSFAYIFIQKDKFIKFRTSFIAEESPNWNGHHVVQQILPKLEIPGESKYMQSVRYKHKQQLLMQVIQSISAPQNDDVNSTAD